ncbi:ribonuclease H-like domain-containing protein [Tanacetum coccineum]
MMPHQWIIDLGANQHITNSIKNMTDVIDISELNITVGHPNGTVAKIRHFGNLRLTSNVVLFDVLVILEYTVSLLSVNKMIKDSKLHVGFNEYDCVIKDLKKEIVLGIGSESGGLYLFDVDYKLPKIKSNFSIMCYHVSKSVWHNRLGHPSDQVLKFLKSSLKISKPEHVKPCEICHFSKQTREPLPLSDHKSESLGDLIHLDFWGPYRVTSREGLPSSVLAGKSPFSMLYGREPSLFHLSEPAVVGGARGLRRWRVRLVVEVVLCCGLTVAMMIDGSGSGDGLEIPYDDGNGPSDDAGEVIVDHQSTDTAGEQPFDDDHATSSMDDNPISEGNVLIFQNVPTFDSSNGTDLDSSNVVNIRRSSKVSKLPDKLNDFVLDNKVKYGLNRYVNHTKLCADNCCFISNLNKTAEPTCYNEVVKDINWVQGMNKEMEALYLNNTWILTDFPKNRKAIGSKWVYKIKYKSDGEIERYKARLVAKGFGQKEGIDYDEIFNLVVKMSTMKCFINMVVQNSWDLFRMDVNNAFLYGDLTEDSHFEDALRVLRYLKSAPGASIVYTKSNNKFVSAYADSDWAKCRMTRRSVSAAAVFQQHSDAFEALFGDKNNQAFNTIASDHEDPDVEVVPTSMVATCDKNRKSGDGEQDDAMETVIESMRLDQGEVLEGLQHEQGSLLFRGRYFIRARSKLKEVLLSEFHDTPSAGHKGSKKKTRDAMQRRKWDPGIKIFSQASPWWEGVVEEWGNDTPRFE